MLRAAAIESGQKTLIRASDDPRAAERAAERSCSAHSGESIRTEIWVRAAGPSARRQDETDARF